MEYYENYTVAMQKNQMVSQIFGVLIRMTKTSVYGIIKIEKHTPPRRKYNGSSDP